MLISCSQSLGSSHHRGQGVYSVWFHHPYWSKPHNAKQFPNFSFSAAFCSKGGGSGFGSEGLGCKTKSWLLFLLRKPPEFPLDTNNHRAWPSDPGGWPPGAHNLIRADWLGQDRTERCFVPPDSTAPSSSKKTSHVIWGLGSKCDAAWRVRSQLASLSGRRRAWQRLGILGRPG